MRAFAQKNARNLKLIDNLSPNSKAFYQCLVLFNALCICLFGFGWNFYKEYQFVCFKHSRILFFLAD